MQLEDQTNLLPTGRLILVICGLAGSLLVSFIDQNSIAVALPKIGRELDSVSSIQWAGTSALIANTVFQVLYGRLSDIFGRNVIMLGALALLALGDLLCGFAKTGTQLYIYRAIAGVGNGGITALTMMIVTDIVTLERRGKYQGIIGACVGIGNTVGPFLAAAFVEKSSWRYLFFLICPLAIASGLFIFFTLPSKRPTDDFVSKLKKIDYLGTLFSAAAIIFLLIPISDGGNLFPWSSPTVIALLTVGSLCAIMFIMTEWKMAKLPMMPLYLFTNLAVCAILLQNFLFGIVYYASLYYLPIYFQNARQYSPIISSALTIPLVVGQSITSVISGQYISRRKRYGDVLWFGYTLWTLGAGLRCLFGRHTSPIAIVFIELVEGFGCGCAFQPTLIAAHAHSKSADRAIIVGIRNFTRSLGGAAGLAMSAAIYGGVLRNTVSPNLAALGRLSVYAAPNLSLLSAPDRESMLDAYMTASKAVFIFYVPLMGLCLLSLFMVKDRGLGNPDDEKEEEKEKGKAESSASSEGVLVAATVP